MSSPVLRSSFAERCGVHDAKRSAAISALHAAIRDQGIEQIRVVWCDMHGTLRGKTLLPEALDAALMDGVGMVSTLMLKDTSDRTVLKVFEAGATDHLPGFGQANNLLLLPDPSSMKPLPWAPRIAWLQAQPWFEDGSPVELDTRRILQRAVAQLANAGLSMRCGLELEFHVYKLHAGAVDPNSATWPGDAPEVSLVHSGYQLLSDDHADAAHAVLETVRSTALGLQLPLRSLEIELGPSQFEAVFGVQDAMDAADAMVMFRHAVRQALRRQGYHATFCCMPPFDAVMASGWHVHHSLRDRRTQQNTFMRDTATTWHGISDARDSLSDMGCHWLAGLLHHAPAMAALCVPTALGYARFRPNALAPLGVHWGRDNRGAMVRVIGEPNNPATRLENRLPEPAANPYLAMAAHIHAGMDGLQQRLTPPLATQTPYACDATTAAMPKSLSSALEALNTDQALRQGLGSAFCDLYAITKGQEMQRLSQAGAEGSRAWMRREYFVRF